LPGQAVWRTCCDILVRNAEALETLAKVDTLVIDKTGTLTGREARVSRCGVSSKAVDLPKMGCYGWPQA